MKITLLPLKYIEKDKFFVVTITIFLFAILMTIGNAKLFGQAHQIDYKHILYIEGLGIGGFGSVNYEGVFFQDQTKKISLSGRIGLGTNNVIDYQNKFNPDLLIPIGIYAFYGKTHHLEIGLSYILSLIVQASPQFKPSRIVNSNLSFSIGYRYQNHPKGFFAGVRYSPILEFYKHFRHWASAYVGYCF